MRDNHKKSHANAGLRVSLRLRSAAIPVLFVLAMGVIFTFLISSINRYVTAQNTVQFMSEQKILNQRFMKEVLLSAQNIPVSHRYTGSLIRGSLTSLSVGGVATLLNGQDVYVDALPTGEITQRQAEMNVMFDSIEEKTEKYLKGVERDRQSGVMLTELYDSALQTQAAADEIVNSYDRHLDTGMPWEEENAVAVELAERQRMLLQQHIKEILFVANGIPADYQKTRLAIHESLSLLSGGGTIALSGTEVVELKASESDDIRFSLSEMARRMQRFTEISNQYLMLANRNVDQIVLLRELSDLNAAFHMEALQSLALTRAYYDSRIDRAKQESILAGILAAIFALIMMWFFIRDAVLQPLGLIQAGLSRLIAGDTSKLVEGCRNDEIGDSAGALNRLTMQVRERAQVAKRLVEGRVIKQPIGEESDFHVVGRLPNPAPFGDEKQIFQQLVNRTKELEEKNQELSAVNEELREQTISLSESESRLRKTEEEVHEKNRGLFMEAQELKSSEQRLLAQQEELYAVNRVLAKQTEQQSSELSQVHQELQKKTGSLIETEQRLVSVIQELKKSPQAGRESKGLAKDLKAFETRYGDEAALLKQLHDQSEILGNEDKPAGEEEYEDKLEDLSQTIQKLKHSRRKSMELERQLSEKTIRIARLEQELESVRRVRRSSNEELSGIQKELDELRGCLSEKMASLERTIGELNAARKMAETHRVAVEKMSGELAVREDKIKELEDKSKGREDALIHAWRTIEAKSSQLRESDRRLEAADKDLMAARRLLEEQARQARRLKESEKASRNEAQKNEGHIQAIQGEIERLTQSFEQSDKLQKEKDEALKSAEAELLKLKKETMKHEHELVERRNAEQEAVEKLGVMEENLRETIAETEEKARNSVAAAEEKARNSVAAAEEELRLTVKKAQEAFEQLSSTQSELEQSRKAYREKCEDLKAADHRLKSTRHALKASLDELQEKMI